MAKGRTQGALEFEMYYSQLMGEGWPVLRSTLLLEPPKVDLQLTPEGAVYRLDPASVWVAEALQVRPGHQVLDMCAAPGGKALVLLRALSEARAPSDAAAPDVAAPPGVAALPVGRLTVNDVSRDRVERLRRVIHQHASPSMASAVRFWRGDATQLGVRHPQAFDRVLLDAPCSGERHLLASPRDLGQWSPSRSKHLARRQYGLLCSAALLLRPGGRLVYSTCTLNPVENSNVIERFMERKPGALRWLNEPGVYQRPDIDAGAGPMYMAVFEKTAP
jgi:5-methylcytosine rRNA methyltransferase NSUN4